jgi:WD40 repeat protein
MMHHLRIFSLFLLLLIFKPSLSFTQEDNLRGITTMEWSPNDAQLAIGYQFGYLQIMDIASNEITLSSRLALDDNVWIYSLSWSPDGTKIAVPVANVIRIVDVETGEITELIEDSCDSPHTYNRYTSVDWSPDGTKLVVGNECDMSTGYHAAIQIWDVATAELLLSCRLGWDCDAGHDVAPFNIDWSVNGSQIVSASVNRVIVWDAETLEPLYFLTPEQDTNILSMAVSHDGAYISVGLWNLDGVPYNLTIWDAATGLEIISFPYRAEAIAWNANGTNLVAVAQSNSEINYMIELVDIENGEVTQIADGANVSIVTWSHNGEYIAYNISHFPEARQDSIELISVADLTTISPASPTP